MSSPITILPKQRHAAQPQTPVPPVHWPGPTQAPAQSLSPIVWREHASNPAPSPSRPAEAAPMAGRGSRSVPHPPVLQRMESAGLRSKGKGKSAALSGVYVAPPDGYKALSTSFIDSLRGQVDTEAEKNIYYKIYKGKTFIWWAYPLKHVPSFTYFGNRQDDIDYCETNYGRSPDYVWHHTGYPHEEAAGDMQWVPRSQHEAIPHYGGIYISKGN